MATYTGFDAMDLGQQNIKATGFEGGAISGGLGAGQVGIIGRPTLGVKKIQIRRLE